jgi:hypothetical protein
VSRLPGGAHRTLETRTNLGEVAQTSSSAYRVVCWVAARSPPCQGSAAALLSPQAALPSATLPDAALTFTGAPSRFARGQLFGLDVRVSKNSGTAVVDTTAFGKLYASPLTLARFEENAGATNTSTVRLEGNAAFGVERTSAAVRVKWREGGSQGKRGNETDGPAPPWNCTGGKSLWVIPLSYPRTARTSVIARRWGRRKAAGWSEKRHPGQTRGFAS